MSQPPAPPHPADRPTRWHWLGLLALAVTSVAFSAVVEVRGAFLTRRMTDAQVYFRAAWAARTGHDIYAVTDDNHWHYHYPPLLAILLAPLADAPAGAGRADLLPYAVSLGLWYWAGVAFLAAGAHALASALAPEVPRGSRRWWALRLLPLLACLPAVFATLARGQVNLLLLALLCFAAAAGLRGRPFRAGLWLAAAVCVKVIPALLLVIPLWRRDARCLAGCAAGLVVGLALVPAAWFGPRQAADYVREWGQVLAGPALGEGDDHARDHELIDMTATDSQSLLSMVHNTAHFDRETRPHQPDRWARLAHWIGGGLMAAVTLLAAGRRPGGDRLRPLLLLGALALVMVLLSPVCHLHYFCLALPLVMGLVARDWGAHGGPRLSPRLALLLALNFVANGLVHLPGADVLRDLGAAGYATILLWLCGVAALWQTRPRAEAQGHLPAAAPPVSVEGVELRQAG